MTFMSMSAIGPMRLLAIAALLGVASSALALHLDADRAAIVQRIIDRQAEHRSGAKDLCIFGKLLMRYKDYSPPGLISVADLKIDLKGFAICPVSWADSQAASYGMVPPMIEIGEPDIYREKAMIDVDHHDYGEGEGTTYTLQKIAGAWRTVAEDPRWVS